MTSSAAERLGRRARENVVAADLNFNATWVLHARLSSTSKSSPFKQAAKWTDRMLRIEEPSRIQARPLITRNELKKGTSSQLFDHRVA